jgi:hypothetical protein
LAVPKRCPWCAQNFKLFFLPLKLRPPP